MQLKNEEMDKLERDRLEKENLNKKKRKRVVMPSDGEPIDDKRNFTYP